MKYENNRQVVSTAPPLKVGNGNSTQVVSTQSGKKIKQVKEFESIMSCIFEHEITKTTAEYEWSGPVFGREMWNEVLAFFRWTQATTKSESQVRLYVNHVTMEWKAWAYPQTLGTGMTTREIENEDAKVQRAQFSDGDGWLYYGTVHHHCNASAFQSGTDEANERNQDGIHITVGKLETEQYDIDARLYQSGFKICDFEIEEFWDVGDVYEGIPPHVKQYLPKDYPQRMVLLQMGTPPPSNQTFPEVWKTNLIREVRVSPVTIHDSSYGNYGNFYGGAAYKPFSDRSAMETDFDRKRFISDTIRLLGSPAGMAANLTIKDVREVIIKAQTTFVTLLQLDVLDIMVKNDCRFETALKCLTMCEEKMAEMALEKELEQKLGKHKGRSQHQLGLPTAAGNGTSTKPNCHAGALEHMEYEGGSHYASYGSGLGIGG